MSIIKVKAGASRYPVFIENNIQDGGLSGFIKSTYSRNTKIAIVTNNTIDKLYPDITETLFKGLDNKLEKLVLQDGEEFKSFISLQIIYDRLLESNIHRNDIIVAFGGGVIGDMAGLAASTFNRGTNLIHVPTTIIGQVDSSIGGKVAVNYKKIKNIIGTFYQPEAVFIDPVFLRTLNEKEIINGCAEIVKYGILFDRSILADFRNNLDIKNDERLYEMVFSDWFINIIEKCINIKAKVVSKDVFDRNYRNLLNFGHTIGHALEKTFKLEGISHGEAVSIGMIAAINISISLNLIDNEFKNMILNIYKLLKLPHRIKDCDLNDILHSLKFDKKTKEGKNRFILIKGINKPFIYNSLDKGVIIDNIKKCMYNYI